MKAVNEITFEILKGYMCIFEDNTGYLRSKQSIWWK